MDFHNRVRLAPPLRWLGNSFFAFRLCRKKNTLLVLPFCRISLHVFLDFFSRHGIFNVITGAVIRVAAMKAIGSSRFYE